MRCKKEINRDQAMFQITYSTCWENKTLYLKHNRKKMCNTSVQDI